MKTIFKIPNDGRITALYFDRSLFSQCWTGSGIYVCMQLQMFSDRDLQHHIYWNIAGFYNALNGYAQTWKIMKYFLTKTTSHQKYHETDGVRRISRVTNRKVSLQKNRLLHSCLSRTVTYFKSNFFAKQGQMATSANSIYNSFTMKNFHVHLNLKF